MFAYRSHWEFPDGIYVAQLVATSRKCRKVITSRDMKAEPRSVCTKPGNPHVENNWERQATTVLADTSRHGKQRGICQCKIINNYQPKITTRRFSPCVCWSFQQYYQFSPWVCSWPVWHYGNEWMTFLSKLKDLILKRSDNIKLWYSLLNSSAIMIVSPGSDKEHCYICRFF